MTKKSQRGFVLAAALSLAVLYFLLMELVLIDSSRALAEAQRFRSRTVAAAMAENGAELAAQDMIDQNSANVTATNAEGIATGSLARNGNQFVLKGSGRTKGVVPQTADVVVQGTINTDKTIVIDYTEHSQ